MVSLFSSRTSSLAVARMPALFARGEPAVAWLLADPNGGPAGADGCDAAVGRRVVDDDDVVRSLRGGDVASDARQFSRCSRAL